MPVTDKKPGKRPFEIKIDENARPPVVSLKGDVDVASSDKLHQQLSRLVENGHKEIEVDCSGVSYFDSTGLSELVWASKRMPENGKVRLTGCSPRILKLLDITGLSGIFELVPAEG